MLRHHGTSAWLSEKLSLNGPLEGKGERRSPRGYHPTPASHWEPPCAYGLHLLVPLASAAEARSHSSGGRRSLATNWTASVGRTLWSCQGIDQPWWQLRQSKWLRVQDSRGPSESEEALKTRPIPRTSLCCQHTITLPTVRTLTCWHVLGT